MPLFRLAVFFSVLGTASTAAAQRYIGRDTPRTGSVEVSGGGLFETGQDLDDFTATLTRNPTTGSGPLELFSADASLRPAIGLQARIGYYLSAAFSIEGGVQVSRPSLQVRLSGDFESAPDTVAKETINSYLFTGSALYHFRARKKLKPFVLGGAGHVRDLHAANELVETGLEYHAGGGVKSWFGTRRRKLGIRADVLVSVRDGGVATEASRRIVPTASLSLAYLF